jgi:hypothetical protein
LLINKVISLGARPCMTVSKNIKNVRHYSP